MGRKTAQKILDESDKCAYFDNYLKSTKKKIQKIKRDKKQKHLSPTDLERLLGAHRYSGHYIQEAKNFTSRSHNETRQKKEYLTFMFCRYRVPSFLYKAWDGPEQFDYIGWFLCLAEGSSLYKRHTKEFMSKAATHIFINYSDPRLSIQENVWRAIWRSEKIENNIITRFLRTGVFTRSRANSNNVRWWKSAAKFFTVNIVDDNAFQELFDFIGYKRGNDQNYSLKGRTLASVIRQSNQWHQEIQRKRPTENGSWEGLPVPTWTHKEKIKLPGSKTVIVRTWKIEQIKDSNTLYREGSIMKHCVGGYASQCIAGNTSIFKMISFDPGENGKKKLTIQVTNLGRSVVQVRGVCNRVATPHEQFLLTIWKREALNCTTPQTNESDS